MKTRREVRDIILDHLLENIKRENCIISVYVEVDFPIIRILTDGLLFMKAVHNRELDKVEVVWDSSYRDQAYIKPVWANHEPKQEEMSIQEFAEYCVDRHLERYPHHATIGYLNTHPECIERLREKYPLLAEGAILTLKHLNKEAK